ncbi:MAG: hypothetical protein K2X81_05390, partial [Candidatus Obscuribacterales bacterium]|nr:hypothetical protein [Candidatus Obscuribacterales bacterium]
LFRSNTSLIANNMLNSTAGIYASDLWLVGGMFGGSKESTDKIIEQMAHARQKNEEEALLQRNQVVNDGKSQVRGFLGDATGVATSFGTGWLTNRGLNMLTTSLEKAPLPFWGKALVVVPTALAAGGLANNAVAGNDLLSSKGYIRNTVATGTTYAAIKGLEYLPGRQTLSAETTAKLANKLGYAEGAQVTGMQVARDATAAEAALGKSKIVQIAEAIGPRVNPINYTPFKFVPAEAGKSSWNLISRFRVAGMGGERTAAMFANGTMSLAEYNTRLFAAKAMSTAALGYGFGVSNKGAAIYTGEHLDGKKYDTPGAVWADMNQAGLNTALAASITVPLAGAFVPGFAKNAVGNGVTSMFTRMGVADVPTAAAALGTSSLMFAQSGLDSGGRFGESRIFADMYRRSDKRFNELKLQELAQQAAQQGVAPKPEEKK